MEYALLFLFTFIAYFVKAITGFGDTLVMNSLFSFTVPNSVTTPVNLLLSIPANAAMTVKNRKNLSLKIILPLSLTLFIGVLPGTFLLTHMSSWVLKAVLGFVLILLALEMLTRKADPNAKANPAVMVAVGILSGLLCGLFGIGALLAAFISRTTDTKSRYRGNLCCIFLLENIFRFFVYLSTGVFTASIFKLTAIVLPAMALGLLVGAKADVKLKETTVKKATIYLLMISGAFLCVQNLLFH